MDTFVDSSWYFMRYTDPAQRRGRRSARARRLLATGQPVHRRDRARDPPPDVRALLHQGAARPRPVGFQEPFARLFNQGMIYRFGAKMSKSKGNVVSPDDLVDRYGADALRLYILFMGPADQDKEWQDTGVDGDVALPDALWRVVNEQAYRARAVEPREPTALARKAHETIQRSATISSGASSSTCRSPR